MVDILCGQAACCRACPGSLICVAGIPGINIFPKLCEVCLRVMGGSFVSSTSLMEELRDTRRFNLHIPIDCPGMVGFGDISKFTCSDCDSAIRFEYRRTKNG